MPQGPPGKNMKRKKMIDFEQEEAHDGNYQDIITDLEKTLTEMEERIYALEDHLVDDHGCVGSTTIELGMRARNKIFRGNSE